MAMTMRRTRPKLEPLEPQCVESVKEKTTKKNRDYEDTMKTKDLQCIGINIVYADTHVFSK